MSGEIMHFEKLIVAVCYLMGFYAA